MNLILNNIKKQSFATRDEQEVAGYAELMEDIFENYEVIPFNENHIKQKRFRFGQWWPA